MKHRLDVVIVGIKHERCIVGGMVFAVKTGCAVVAAAGGKGGGVEGAHRWLIERDECHVRMVGIFRAEVQAKIVGARHTKGEALSRLPEELIAQRCQCRLVESTADAQIADAQGDVIKDVLTRRHRMRQAYEVKMGPVDLERASLQDKERKSSQK